MERDIVLFQQLPYELRRRIVLFIKVFHELGYKLMRPLKLDMRHMALGPYRDSKGPFGCYHSRKVACPEYGFRNKVCWGRVQ